MIRGWGLGLSGGRHANMPTRGIIVEPLVVTIARRENRQRRSRRNRNALPITETALNAMANAATIGLSNKPKNG